MVLPTATTVLDTVDDADWIEQQREVSDVDVDEGYPHVARAEQTVLREPP